MDKPTIVCLCGSTRFSEAFHEANLRETLAGRIVLSIGCDFKSDRDLEMAGQLTPADKQRLDELHLRKIDLADEVLILNVGGYVGESTTREIAYAQAHGKRIRWLSEEAEIQAAAQAASDRLEAECNTMIAQRNSVAEDAVCEPCHVAGTALRCPKCKRRTCVHYSLWSAQDAAGPNGEQLTHRCNWCEVELEAFIPSRGHQLPCKTRGAANLRVL